VGIVAATEVVRSPQARASSGAGYVVYVPAAIARGSTAQDQGVLAFSTTGAPEGAIASPQGGSYSVAISPNAGEVYASVYGDGESLGGATISSAANYEPGAGASLASVGAINEAQIAGPAVSPNGQFVYTAGEGGLDRVSTGNPAATAQAFAYPPRVSGVGEVFIPESLALSNDGATAFIGGYEYNPQQLEAEESVPLLIAMATNGSGAFYWPGPLTNSPSSGLDALAVSPNGSTLWATETDPNTPQVLQIPLPITNNAGLPGGTALKSEPSAVAVAPNGSTVFVGTEGPGGRTQLFQLSTDAPPVVSSISLPPSFARARSAAITGLAVTPDGQTLMVAGDIEDSATAITSGLLLEGSIPTNSPAALTAITSSIQPAAQAGTLYYGIAITPDQAPVARVAVNSAQTTAGGSVTFSTDSSTVAFGSVTGFQWNVPGGNCDSLTAPTITCQFPGAGTFAAQVTETDSAGNSTAASGLPPGAVVFTGATASLVPSGSAKSAPAAVTVTSAPTTTSATTTTPTTASTTTTTTAPTTTTPKSTGHPKLTVNPGIGPPGFVTQVDGTGFPPNTPLTVTWSVGIGSVQVTTSAAGTFSVPMLVMAEDRPGNRNAQVATFPKAKAPFLVVPGSLQPGGDSYSIVFNR